MADCKSKKAGSRCMIHCRMCKMSVDLESCKGLTEMSLSVRNKLVEQSSTMVFFVCAACGGSFKKKQATMHTFRCSNWAFSCMDCGRDFSGHSFAEHNQCITESEKYHGSDHTPKSTQDKNALWMEKLKKYLAKQQTTPFLSKLIIKMLEMPSIPRKEPKFKNFVRTNMNISSNQIIQNLWELVSGANAAEDDRNSNGNAANKENASVQNGCSNKESCSTGKAEHQDQNQVVENSVLSESSFTKDKKRKASQEEDDIDAENDLEENEQPQQGKSKRRKKNKLRQSATDEPDDLSYRSGFATLAGQEDYSEVEGLSIDTVTGIKKFKWRSTIKRILRAGPPEGMKISKLLHKIEQEYNNPVSGAAIPMSKDEIRGIMIKTLNKKPFSMANQRAKVGKFSVTADDE
ncbi:Zinc finger C2H2 LYAR-type [Trinorchestia longiramus]|nr:Zinc finger C2H2 LYAR-type [Trinorchestia longiramus]